MWGQPCRAAGRVRGRAAGGRWLLAALAAATASALLAGTAWAVFPLRAPDGTGPWPAHSCGATLGRRCGSSCSTALAAISDAGAKRVVPLGADILPRDAELLFRAPVQANGTWPPPTRAELEALAQEEQTVPSIGAASLRGPLNFEGPRRLLGLTDHWPIRTWDAEEFFSRLGDVRMKLRPCSTLHEYGFPGPSERRVSLQAYFADNVCDACLIFENDFQPVHHALRGTFEVPQLLEEVHGAPVFSAGRVNTGIGFHRHNEAWLAQLRGRKAWFLLPPSSPRPAVLPPWWYLDARPHGLRFCVLEPGEVLFLPANWWHATWNLEEFTVAVGWEGGASKSWGPDMRAVANGDVSRLDAANVPSAQMVNLAARAGHIEVMRWLIEEDADLTLRANAAPAAMAAVRGGHTAVLELLAGYRTALAGDSGGRTALHAAAQCGQAAAAEWLLAHGAEVRARDVEGTEPLQLAASHGHCEALEALLAAGADARATDNQGSAPLPAAAFNGHRAAVEVLLGARADPGTRDALEVTALHLAALRGHASVAEAPRITGGGCGHCRPRPCGPDPSAPCGVRLRGH